jgi:hypothetical protein
VRLHSVRWHSVYVAPLRLLLGIGWLFAARAAGASGAGAVLAFGSGAFFTVFLSFNDPRSRFLRRLVGGEPKPLPADATIASPVRQALTALLPSTAGLSVLAAIAVVPKPVLAALLGGISAGLGVAGLMHAYVADPALFFDRRTGVTYRR